MKIEFIGAAHEVTGSCTLVTACGKRFLVDCGMEQGKDLFENAELPVAPGSLDFILLTHAHIDHAGRIPEMAAKGFSRWSLDTRLRVFFSADPVTAQVFTMTISGTPPCVHPRFSNSAAIADDSLKFNLHPNVCITKFFIYVWFTVYLPNV